VRAARKPAVMRGREGDVCVCVKKVEACCGVCAESLKAPGGVRCVCMRVGTHGHECNVDLRGTRQRGAGAGLCAHCACWQHVFK
jgi:hypothetical protein